MVNYRYDVVEGDDTVNIYDHDTNKILVIDYPDIREFMNLYDIATEIPVILKMLGYTQSDWS